MSYVKPRDWVEDSADENGNYANECPTCKNTFRGHKRRVTCKLCTVNGPSITEKMQPAIAELMRQKAEWSEQMAVDCIVQAIKCGDFTRLLQGDKESYVYVPFQRESELQQKIEALQKQQPKRYTEDELRDIVFEKLQRFLPMQFGKMQERMLGWLECARFLGMIKTEGGDHERIRTGAGHTMR